MLLTRITPSQCNPLSGFGTLRRFQDDVERLFASKEPSQRSWLPPLELNETLDNFVVTLELPGVKAADVKVTLEEGVLKVGGERKFEGSEKSKILLSERFYGAFERSVRLPAPVQIEKVSACSKDGILTITLPKTEEAKPREIKVAVA